MTSPRLRLKNMELDHLQQNKFEKKTNFGDIRCVLGWLLYPGLFPFPVIVAN